MTAMPADRVLLSVLVGVRMSELLAVKTEIGSWVVKYLNTSSVSRALQAQL